MSAHLANAERKPLLHNEVVLMTYIRGEQGILSVNIYTNVWNNKFGELV